MCWPRPRPPRHLNRHRPRLLLLPPAPRRECSGDECSGRPEVRPSSPLRGTTQKSQPDPSHHGEEDPRIAARERSADAGLRGRHDQDRHSAQGRQESFKASEGVNLTFLPFIAKAVVEALKAPERQRLDRRGRQEITYYGNVHLGIAVGTDQGLLSPVIHNADDLSIAGLAGPSPISPPAPGPAGSSRTGWPVARSPSPTSAARALCSTPRSWFPPQAGMLGTGAIVKRPVVVTEPDGSDVIAIRSMSYLPLTYDHRLIDGADAGRFLTTVRSVSKVVRSPRISVCSRHEDRRRRVGGADRFSPRRHPARLRHRHPAGAQAGRADDEHYWDRDLRGRPAP